MGDTVFIVDPSRCLWCIIAQLSFEIMDRRRVNLRRTWSESHVSDVGGGSGSTEVGWGFDTKGSGSAYWFSAGCELGSLEPPGWERRKDFHQGGREAIAEVRTTREPIGPNYTLPTSTHGQEHQLNMICLSPGWTKPGSAAGKGSGQGWWRQDPLPSTQELVKIGYLSPYLVNHLLQLHIIQKGVARKVWIYTFFHTHGGLHYQTLIFIKNRKSVPQTTVT